MDWQPEPPDRERDALECLLAEARWPEPAPATIRRLQKRWRSLIAGRRPRRRRRWLALAAVGSAVAVGLALGLRSERSANRQPATNLATSSPTGAVQSMGPVQPTGPQIESVAAEKGPRAVPPAAVFASRPPTAYERMMLVAYGRTPKTAAADQTAVREKSASHDKPANDSQKPPPQREVLAGLLARGDLRSVSVFLQQVENPRTSAAALDCLELVEHPPVETLFQCLHAATNGQRTAAARVLGRLNQPAVSQALISMIAHGINRQEAMLALLSSSEATAQQFLACAARDPLLSVTLWNAKLRFQSLTPWRS